MKVLWVVAAPVVAMAVVLTGCSGAANDKVAPSTTDNAANQPPAVEVSTIKTTLPWQDEIKAAQAAGNVGSVGSPCSLPVSFDLEKGWKPQAVDAAAITGNPLVDALAHQGGFTTVCEIDGKPAGHLGFIRIWTGGKPDSTPRQALDDFIAADHNLSDHQFREISAGSTTGVEFTYTRTIPALESTTTGRVLAVATPKGPVLIVVGGLDSDGHKEMLPAYVLARQSIKNT